MASNLQIPAGALFSQFYDRLMGYAANAAAVAAGLANVVNALPAYVQPVYVPLVPLVAQYTLNAADLTAARALATDLKQFPEVLRAREVNVTRLTQSLAAGVKNPRTTPVEFVLLHGSAGTGKSYEIRNRLLAWSTNGPIRFHTWDPTLRPQLERDYRQLMLNLGLYVDDRTFCTGCVPFFQQTAGTLVLDDAGLLFPGFIQLLLANSHALHRIAVTYDSLQTRPPFPEAQALSRQVISTCDWLNLFNPTYATGNRRLAWEVCDLFGMLRILTVGNQIHHGHVVVVKSPPVGVPLFVASPRFAEVIAKSSRDFATTFSATQGLSVDGDIALDLGGMSSAVGDALIYTALTRGNATVYLVLPDQASGSANLVSGHYGNSGIASALLAVAERSQNPVISTANDPDRLVARAIQVHMSRSLPPAALQVLGLAPAIQPITGRAVDHYNIQADPTTTFLSPLPSFIHNTPARINDLRQQTRARETTLTPDTRAFMSTRARVTETLRHRVLVTLDTVLPVASAPTVLPEPRPAHVPDPVTGEHPIRYQELRERFSPHNGRTAQASLNGSHLGLQHSARDRATESISLAERIRPSVAAVRPVHRRRSKVLFEGLQKFVSLTPQALNYGLLATCVDEQLASWLSGRTQRDVERAVERAAVDWSPLVPKLFLKSQRVKKLPKAHAKATKGQIVTDVSHAKLFHDAVWALYVEKQLLKACRPNVYLHARRSLAQTQYWYKKYWDTKEFVTYCDYTGWDSGVDESFTLLYGRVFRTFGVPERVVEKFVYERHNARTFLGPFPAMQASGDRYTWLNNTIGNMALTGASFEFTSEQAAAFSGDDMILCGSADYQYNDVNRQFVPKVVVAPTGEFCGMNFGTPTLHLDPKTLLHRLTMAIEDNRKDFDYYESVSYSLRFADSRSFYEDPHYATIAHTLAAVYQQFGFPPSRFPVQLV
jgi:hypothetical protein